MLPPRRPPVPRDAAPRPRPVGLTRTAAPRAPGGAPARDRHQQAYPQIRGLAPVSAHREQIAGYPAAVGHAQHPAATALIRTDIRHA